VAASSTRAQKLSHLRPLEDHPHEESAGVRHGTKRYDAIMGTKRFIYFEEDGMLVGWLEEYPDYRTQGETMDQLRENLLDLYKELTSGRIPCVHKVGELSIA
jgi:hypothetical protein